MKDLIDKAMKDNKDILNAIKQYDRSKLRSSTTEPTRIVWQQYKEK